MRTRLFFPMLIFALSLIASTAAFAQTDDDVDDDVVDDDADDDAADDDTPGFEDSGLYFTDPARTCADTTYEFEFVVRNGLQKQDGEWKTGEWINRIDLTMPSKDYTVDETQLTAPDPLHGKPDEDEYRILRWEVSLDSDSVTITWQCVGVQTSANYGDIREGEALSFEFVATTDNNVDGMPTDGFPWKLYGDEGSVIEGIAFIENCDPCDDDDDVDDDDVDDDDEDDCCLWPKGEEEDTSGCCG